MAFGNAYTFGFATAICVVCSLSLATVSMGLKERQEDNARRDKQGNILKALGLPEDGGELTPEAIDSLWVERVELRVVDASGAVVEAPKGDQDGDGDLDEEDVELALDAAGEGETPEILGLYVRKDGAKDGAYGMPVYGAGLWGPISGYLALDPKATEVTGVTFFAPKETPGLGAEIMNAKFKGQWTGKRIVDAKGQATPVRVVKGEASTLCPDTVQHCVDGVSGATITSRGVDAMVAQSITWYDPYLNQLRGR